MARSLVIDTRSTHVQAREILTDLRELTARPGDGRRRHARPLRPCLRQPRLPAGGDLGPRAMRDVHGTRTASRDGRGSPANEPVDRGRPARGRHRPAGPDVRRDGEPRSRRPARRAALPGARPHGPRHRHRRAGDAASCSPATCWRTARSPGSATAIPLDWPETAYRVAELARRRRRARATATTPARASRIRRRRRSRRWRAGPARPCRRD